MPIYEYLCDKCEHEFEREQRITADPIKTCPKCKSRRVKKLISQTSFVLKGGGWYNDLYSSAKKDNKSDSSEGAKSESGSDKSGDKQDKKEKKGAKGDAGKKSGSKKSSKSAA
jgi:putative FmdB family regulatory protein